MVLAGSVNLFLGVSKGRASESARTMGNLFKAQLCPLKYNYLSACSRIERADDGGLQTLASVAFSMFAQTTQEKMHANGNRSAHGQVFLGFATCFSSYCVPRWTENNRSYRILNAHLLAKLEVISLNLCLKSCIHYIGGAQEA